jgi:hypothetical protein
MSSIRPLFAVACTGIVIHALVQSRKVTREERAKRDAISQKLQADLCAISFASGVVRERARAGKYYDTGIAAMMNDFEFERIAYFANE